MIDSNRHAHVSRIRRLYPYPMTSIYRRALQSDFERLHPMIQERFGLDSRKGVSAIGTGVMEEVWRGRFHTVPFLYLGTLRNIMFPETGEDVPFKVENYAYVDRFDRETVTWTRTFELETRTRRFDATMIYSAQRDRIVDYLGTHQHLAVDINLSVTENGGLRIRSGAQRFYAGPLGVPFPMFFSGVADVCEWYDDTEETYRIDVTVSNPYWGPLFGYRGTFDVEYRSIDERDVPSRVTPQYVQRRE